MRAAMDETATVFFIAGESTTVFIETCLMAFDWTARQCGYMVSRDGFSSGSGSAAMSIESCLVVFDWTR